MRRITVFIIALAVLLPAVPTVRAAELMFSVGEHGIIPFNEIYAVRQGADGGLLVSSETLYRAIPNLVRVWQPESQNYTLLYSSRMLTFEYGRGTAFTSSSLPSEQYTAELQIATIGGTVVYYVPVALVCDIFGWYHSEHTAEWGRILRISPKEPDVKDRHFYTIYDNEISVQYEKYMAAQATTAVSPTPNPGGKPQSTPAPTPGHSPSPTPSPTPEPQSFILTFEGECGEWAETISLRLEQESLWAAFFLKEDSLAAAPGVLRRLTALHTAAPLLDVGHGDYAAALRNAGEIMRGITFRQNLMYRIAEGEPDRDVATALAAAGYQLWQRHWQWEDGTGAEGILRELDALTARTPLVLSLPLSETGLAVLEGLIQQQDEGAVRLFALEPGRTPSVTEGEGGLG